MGEIALSKPLNEKQRLFVEQYCGEADFNASKAALMAGYSKKTVGQIGYENLKKPEIAEAIAARLRELRETAKTRSENSYQERVDTADLILQRCMQVEQVRNAKGEIIEGEFTFQAKNALTANDQLSKLGGHYAPEKHRVEHEFAGLTDDELDAEIARYVSDPEALRDLIEEVLAARRAK
jgi:phage terminase small subunit